MSDLTNRWSGFYPPGVLAYCNYTIPDQVIVEVNQQVQVTFPSLGGSPPYEVQRVDENGIRTQCEGAGTRRTMETKVYDWTVNEPYNVTLGYANGTVENVTYGNPGDQTYFIAVQLSDRAVNSTWREKETPYWTSQKFVIGNSPLPANGATRGMSMKGGMMLGLLVGSVLFGSLI